MTYRADHVGSLLRPKELLEARANPDVERGEVQQAGPGQNKVEHVGELTH